MDPWRGFKNESSRSRPACCNWTRAKSSREHAFTTDLGAESVQSVELVAMFEEEFGIEMDEDDALSVQTVGDAVTFITKVCQEQGVAV